MDHENVRRIFAPRASGPACLAWIRTPAACIWLAYLDTSRRESAPCMLHDFDWRIFVSGESSHPMLHDFDWRIFAPYATWFWLAYLRTLDSMLHVHFDWRILTGVSSHPMLHDFDWRIFAPYATWFWLAYLRTLDSMLHDFDWRIFAPYATWFWLAYLRTLCYMILTGVSSYLLTLCYNVACMVNSQLALFTSKWHHFHSKVLANCQRKYF